MVLSIWNEDMEENGEGKIYRSQSQWRRTEHGGRNKDNNRNNLALEEKLRGKQCLLKKRLEGRMEGKGQEDDRELVWPTISRIQHEVKSRGEVGCRGLANRQNTRDGGLKVLQRIQCGPVKTSLKPIKFLLYILFKDQLFNYNLS